MGRKRRFRAALVVQVKGSFHMDVPCHDPSDALAQALKLLPKFTRMVVTDPDAKESMSPGSVNEVLGVEFDGYR